MRILICLLFLLFEFSVFSQKIEGRYTCYLGDNLDIRRSENLIFDFNKENTFSFTKIDYIDNDTSIVSKGIYFENNDTICLITPLPKKTDIFFYPNDKIDPEIIKISFYYEGNGWSLTDEIRTYSFYTFDNKFKKKKIVAHDTFPDYSNSLKVFYNEKYNNYITFFLRKSDVEKYIMIYKKTNIWNNYYDGLRESNTITFDISNLKERSVCVRKEKQYFGLFCNLDFVDFSNIPFIIKKDTLLPLNPIIGYEYFKFKKE